MKHRLLLLTVVGLLVAGSAAVAASTGQRDLLADVNRVRVARDRPVLDVRPGMMRRSQEHARAMADAGYLFHSELRLPRGAEWAAEVVGVGGSIRAVVRAWLRSPDHRHLVLRRGADIAGAGIVRDGDRLWMVVQLAQTEGI